MTQIELRPAFIDGQRGKLFVLMRRPAEPKTGVLIAPPFAEEMNKARHLFTDVANRLAAQGVAVVLVDLFGTGDSEGEFGDADWSVWKSDLAAAAAWSDTQGAPITGMLAMRLGCALACEMVRDNGMVLQRCVFWQPVLAGGRALDQFLRLRVAAAMMQGDTKETVASLRAALREGRSVEVAGYDVGGGLAAQLDCVNLTEALSPRMGSIRWIELVRSADAAPPGASLKAIEQARGAGVDIDLHALQGEPFWSSVELTRNPQLVDCTVASLGKLL